VLDAVLQRFSEWPELGILNRRRPCALKLVEGDFTAGGALA
jgi:hypothetical protein